MDITLDMLKSWRACYWGANGDPERARWCEARLPATALQVCDCEEVPARDRLWVLLHPEITPVAELRKLAGAFSAVAKAAATELHEIWCASAYSELARSAKERARVAKAEADRAAHGAYLAANATVDAEADDAGSIWKAVRKASWSAAGASFVRGCPWSVVWADQLALVREVLERLEES